MDPEMLRRLFGEAPSQAFDLNALAERAQGGQAAPAAGAYWTNGASNSPQPANTPIDQLPPLASYAGKNLQDLYGAPNRPPTPMHVGTIPETMRDKMPAKDPAEFNAPPTTALAAMLTEQNPMGGVQGPPPNTPLGYPSLGPVAGQAGPTHQMTIMNGPERTVANYFPVGRGYASEVGNGPVMMPAHVASEGGSPSFADIVEQMHQARVGPGVVRGVTAPEPQDIMAAAKVHGSLAGAEIARMQEERLARQMAWEQNRDRFREQAIIAQQKAGMSPGEIEANTARLDRMLHPGLAARMDPQVAANDLMETALVGKMAGVDPNIGKTPAQFLVSLNASNPKLLKEDPYAVHAYMAKKFAPDILENWFGAKYIAPSTDKRARDLLIDALNAKGGQIGVKHYLPYTRGFFGLQ